MAKIVGSRGNNDNLIGTSLHDWIIGDSKRDILGSVGGNDVIVGLDGNDTLIGDAGDDIKHHSRGGNDVIFGNEGNDRIIGDAWDKLIAFSQGGDDVLYGGDGNDFLYGDAANEINAHSTGGNDILYGGSGNDYLFGDAGRAIKNHSQGGDDELYGGDGNDVIYGDAPETYGRHLFHHKKFGHWHYRCGDKKMHDNGGDDIVQGGAGNDYVDANGGNDIGIYDWDLNNLNLTEAASDIYIGGYGDDELRIIFSENTPLTEIANIGNAIAAYNSFLAINTSEWRWFDFNPFGFDLKVRGWETITSSVVAINDSYSTDEDSSLDSSPASVLDNEVNFDHDMLTVEAVNGVIGDVGKPLVLNSGATLALNSDGTFSYVPNGQYDYLADGETAYDSFEYTVSDGNTTDIATATIIINGVNDAPQNLQLLVPEMIVENDDATLDVVFDDVDISDNHTVSIDWGDGLLQTFNLSSSGLIDRNFGISHNYEDPGDYTVTVTVSDDLESVVNTVDVHIDCSLDVTTTLDGLTNDSLRDAIICANEHAGDDVIDLRLLGNNIDPDVFLLSLAGTGEQFAFSGDLDITDNLTIIGKGAGLTIIDANMLDRVFEVAEGVSLTLENLTVRNGLTPVGEQGGGISARINSDITLKNVEVTHNTANSNGGGIRIAKGSLTVIDSEITDNHTTDSAFNAGGIAANNSDVDITGSLIAGNTARGGAGLLFSGIDANTLTIDKTVFSANVANAFGGGLEVANGNDIVTITNTLFEQNSTNNGAGGAIVVFQNAQMTLDKVTFNDNHANTASTSVTGGGAVAINSQSTSAEYTFTNSTFSGNTANGHGGAIFSNSNNATIHIDNSSFDSNASLSNSGGAIYAGVIDIDNSIISNNAANLGGGIFISRNGDAAINNSTIDDNNAITGGGMYVDTQATATINNGVLEDNHADAGAGIYGINSAEIVLNNSTVDNNDAAAVGGGVALFQGAKATLNDSDITNNSAGFNGGGIDGFIGVEIKVLNNSIIAHNTAASDGGGISAGDTVVINIVDSDITDNTAQGVGGGISTFLSELLISHSNITDNNANFGGGMWNSSVNVNIDDSIFAGNHANSWGGAISSGISNTNITDSLISGNTAQTGGGGGIEIAGPNSNLSIHSSTIDGNTAFVGAAGIVNFGGSTVNIDYSTISNNSLTGFDGTGGIRLEGSSGSITNSTISGNTSTAFSGGIRLYDANYDIINSTISGNSVNNSFGTGGVDIAGNNAIVDILNSTITGNTGPENGLTSLFGATTNIGSSIIAQNGIGADALAFLGGVINSLGNNLIGNAGASPTFTPDVSDFVGTSSSPLDALLGALANNGGPTLTHLPDPNSLAIDNGANNLNLSTDQRGEDREYPDDLPDIGAVEHQPDMASLPLSAGDWWV